MSGSILEFSQDITDAPPPAPLPKGPYRGEIIGATWRTSASTGNEYAQINVRIPEESYPADFTDGEPDGMVLSYNRLPKVDTPRARYSWRLFLQKVGGPMGRSIDLNALIGLPIVVDIEHQDYEGEVRASIARVLAP